MSTSQSSRRTLSSVAPYWILANVLPPALLAVAGWVYLSLNGLDLAGLFERGGFAKLPDRATFAIATAAVYVVASVGMRGAVLRPLVPRFSIVGWVAAALIPAVLMLALTAGGSVVALALAKGLAVSRNTATIPIPEGFALGPFVLGLILGTEVMGMIVGGLPGLALAAGEALVVGRATRSVWRWILWGAAAWTTVVTIVILHAFLAVFDRSVPVGLLNALGFTLPVILGIAVALITLPAVARLVSRQNASA
jgi:hypothetical protein